MAKDVNQGKVYRISMPITESARVGFQIPKEKVVWRKISAKPQQVYIVETDSRQTYYGCMDEYWAEAQRDKRSKDSFTFSKGKLKRISRSLADENCIPGEPVSLDALYEDSGFEPLGYSDTEAQVMEKLMKEAIMQKAFEAGHNIFVIVGHLLENPKYPEKELMKELGIKAQTTVSSQKKTAWAIIAEECGKWL